MPFHPSIVDDLASAGANVVIDAQTIQPNELKTIVQLWDRGSGSVTIKNASKIPSGVLVTIARTLGGRVTLEE